MPDMIGVAVDGLTQMQKKLANMPQPVKDAAVDGVTAYLINVFRDQPPPRFVSRAEAYPEATITFANGRTVHGYFSVAQYRFVMALWAQGRVPHRRTQELARGWRQVGKGERSFIVNDTPGASFVMGDSKTEQSRHEKLVGWKGVDVIQNEKMPKMLKVADGEIKKALKKIGIDSQEV